jgi:hypothetical protein
MSFDNFPEQNEDEKGSRLTEVLSIIFVTIVMVFLFIKIIFF